MKSIVAWIVFFILVVAGPVAAEDTAETQKAFSGTGEAGVLMTTGNSETESVNARLGLKYETGYLLAEAAAAALYRSEETDVGGQTVDKTSAEKYTCSAKLGYKFNAANYVFVHAAFEDDRFSGYDYQSTYTAGYGRKVIVTDAVRLHIEAGPGYRYDKREDGETEEDGIFRGYAVFGYNFSDGVSFQQEVTVVTGSDNTNTRAVSALKSRIVGALSMKVSYTVDHDSDVPPGTDKTDTETALTLVYDF
ncbi:MAG: DUF481 domain-containing protein [Thermodesulfobacteriota bacterium]|nr:DUF481 domain-containing protein [Thermodesulfobacteriota bacterium]